VDTVGFRARMAGTMNLSQLREPLEGSRGFPLGRWVDDHSTARYNLALSGMRGALRSVPRLLRNPPEAGPEDLREALALMHRVDPARVFLTHGGHEANFLALTFLRFSSRNLSHPLKIRVDHPEYPPILDIARATRGTIVERTSDADIWVLSNPNNPTGQLRSAQEILEESGPGATVIVDEAFREFTEAHSVLETRSDRLWATGTFTKVYGADEIRVGWLIPPATAAEAYARFHSVAADRIPPSSVRSAVAILAARKEVLRETRQVFSRNLRAAEERLPGVTRSSGPFFFDRGTGSLPGDRVQTAALRRSVLVCSGSFFGDPAGVRICLTRPSFPEDFEQYLAVRKRFTSALRLPAQARHEPITETEGRK
jgi:histidinol-phosphate aminotransferase